MHAHTYTRRALKLLGNMGALIKIDADSKKDQYWTNAVGLVTIAANVVQNHNSEDDETRATAGIRRQFCQYVFQMCEKMFGILLNGARANAQMSPDQYVAITSRIDAGIKEFVEPPLLLVNGLRAELAGKEDLEAKLQSAEVRNSELVQGAATQTTRHVVTIDNAQQHNERVQANLETKIKQLRDGGRYKAAESDFNEVRLQPGIEALVEVPLELQHIPKGLTLSIPNLASLLFSMKVPRHAKDWPLLQNSMGVQIRPKLQEKFKGWTGRAANWPKKWKVQSPDETVDPEKFLCLFAALAERFKDLWARLDMEKVVPDEAPAAASVAEEAAPVAEAKAGDVGAVEDEAKDEVEAKDEDEAEVEDEGDAEDESVEEEEADDVDELESEDVDEAEAAIDRRPTKTKRQETAGMLSTKKQKK